VTVASMIGTPILITRYCFFSRFAKKLFI